MRAALGSHRTAHWFRPQSIVQVLINLPMRASCKKYSPRKSIMECDINSILGERWCAENKSPLFLLKLALKLRAEKKSQLFLKWWLSTYADAGIHNTAWKNISGPEHHFPFFFSFFLAGKLLSWRGNGLQLSQTKTPLPKSHRGGRRRRKKKQFGLYVEQIVCVLNIPVRFISTSWAAASSPRRLHLRAVWKLRLNHWRAALRTPTRESVPAVILSSQAGRPEMPNPARLKNPILTKVEIGQLKSIGYFVTAIKWKQQPRVKWCIACIGG